MPVGNRAVICAPVVHYVVRRLERALARATGSKPSAGPSIVRSLPKRVGNLVGERHRPTLGNLHYRPKTFYHIESYHGTRHFRFGDKARGVTAPSKISQIGIRPRRCFHTSVDILIRHLPPFFHNGVAVFVLNLAASVHASRTRVNQVNKAVCFLCLTLDIVARYAFYRLARPVRSHVGKDLRSAREQFPKQHTYAVQAVVFGGEDIRFSCAVPIERGIQNTFGEIAVGIEIRPLSLTLETCGNRVMPHHFFFRTLRQVLVAVHKVLDDARHFRREFPVLFLLLFRALELGRVFIEVCIALRLYPSERFLIFLFVVNTLAHTADNFHLVHAFYAHTEVFLKEVHVHDRACNTHTDRADLEVRFTAHSRYRYRRASKAQNLFSYVAGDGRVVQILYVVAVNTKRRQTLLCVPCKYSSKVYRTRTLRAVKAPYCLNRHRVHIHRFATVAPAGRYGERDIYALFLEFIRASCRLRYSADSRVCNNDLYRLAVRIEHVFLNKLCGVFRHIHSLYFETLPYL